MKISKTLRIVLIILFAICIGMMIYLVLTPSFPIHINVQSGRNPTFFMVGRAPINYIPFQEIGDIGFLLNMIMTMPLGGFILLLSNGNLSFLKTIFCGFLTGFILEFMQLVLDNLTTIFHRFIDINDVISNMIGVVIGFYLLMVVINLIDRLAQNKRT